MLFEGMAIIRHTLYKGTLLVLGEGPVLEAIRHFKVLGMRVRDPVPRHQETQNGLKMVPFLLCKAQRFCKGWQILTHHFFSLHNGWVLCLQVGLISPWLDSEGVSTHKIPWFFLGGSNNSSKKTLPGWYGLRQYQPLYQYQVPNPYGPKVMPTL